MSWIKISDDNGGIYCQEASPDPVQTVTGDDLRAELSTLQERLTQIPFPPTDEELLEWAKSNYPFFNREQERKGLQDRVDKINSILEVE